MKLSALYQHHGYLHVRHLDQSVEDTSTSTDTGADSCHFAVHKSHIYPIIYRLPEFGNGRITEGKLSDKIGFI